MYRVLPGLLMCSIEMTASYEVQEGLLWFDLKCVEICWESVKMRERDREADGRCQCYLASSIGIGDGWQWWW